MERNLEALGRSADIYTPDSQPACSARTQRRGDCLHAPSLDNKAAVFWIPNGASAVYHLRRENTAPLETRQVLVRKDASDHEYVVGSSEVYHPQHAALPPGIRRA